jgi:hypothetical protein
MNYTVAGLIVSYVVGCAITSGVIGGVRDEMDGIGDMFCIVFWPLVLVVMVPVKLLKLCYNPGTIFKK